jgi:hypothetical protein
MKRIKRVPAIVAGKLLGTEGVADHLEDGTPMAVGMPSFAPLRLCGEKFFVSAA